MPRNMLKEICEFIQADDRNSNIMDCYEDYLDGEMDLDTLIMICQRVLGENRDDWITNPEPLRSQWISYIKWLGIHEGEE